MTIGVIRSIMQAVNIMQQQSLVPDKPKMQCLPINCCGIVQLVNIPGVASGTIVRIETGRYVYEPVETAIVSALAAGGFLNRTYGSSEPPPSWETTVGYVGAICWTDAEYMKNGAALAEFFIKKGYKVQTTDIGINPRYGTKEHFLRHWIAFTGPKGHIGDDAERLSITREYTYKDEQQKQKPAEKDTNSGNYGTGVRQFRAAT